MKKEKKKRDFFKKRSEKEDEKRKKYYNFNMRNQNVWETFADMITQMMENGGLFWRYFEKRYYFLS